MVRDIKAHGLASLDACFAVKSPGTLLKRYYSLRSYFHWDDKEDDGIHFASEREQSLGIPSVFEEGGCTSDEGDEFSWKLSGFAVLCCI